MMNSDGLDLGGSDGVFPLSFGSGPLSAPTTATPTRGSETFEKNMLILGMTSPEAVRRIRMTPPDPNVEWVDTEEGDPGLVLHEPAPLPDPFALIETPVERKPGRVLASRRRPVTEAGKLVETVDLNEAAAACVLGFGAGYHCRALGSRMGKMGAVVCFEPDLALLRAVFERIDHTVWMATTNFILITRADDPSAISAAVRGTEAILGLGVRIVEHPASRQRLAPHAPGFQESFTRALQSMRTGLMTTLVRAQASFQNVLMNADHYARWPGIGDLAGVCRGVPAVVVSAGPSLSRTIDRLAQPGMRERVVIIAVQTTLKPLLRRGIKPHFVCALDYHELSKRFYEGLTAQDVEGVTLVVEPKANPAILDAFPGAIRCVQDTTLDSTLGDSLAGEKSPIKPGATVAHLCAYLARHLGCDPLIFIGQDLGFTDGQYYAPGASIHDVWAGELGPMRTLEMFEWERIVRARSMLRKAEDHLGRPIYTDEQMATYLNQFEMDFAEDIGKGLRIIDATEGGVRKRNAETLTLDEALARCQYATPVPGEALAPAPPTEGRTDAITARLETVAVQAERVEALSRKAAGILRKMIGASASSVDRLITEVYAVRDEVRALQPAYDLVQHINQTGALRRFKADREIHVETLDERERQRRQIERDIDNVNWTADAAGELADLLRDSARAIRGEGPKATRDPVPREIEQAVQTVRVGAVLMADHELNGLGLPRDTDAEIRTLGEPAIRLTVRRLLRAQNLDAIVVASGNAAWLREQLGELADEARVRIEAVDADRLRARTRAVGRARLMSPDAWRGSLGGLACYDESLEPALALGLLDAAGLDAGVFVGADWALVDPALVDQVAARYRERPDTVRLSLTQAVPGLAGILLDRRALSDISAGMGHASNYASVGGALAYLPVAPQADPIAKAFCVAVPHGVRDAGRRLVPDTPEGLALVGAIIDRLGPAWLDTDADGLVGAILTRMPGERTPPPRHLELELCTGRLAGGVRTEWLRGGDLGDEPDGERPVMETRDAVRIVEAFARGRPDTVLTLHGVGDPLLHPGIFEILSAARAAGVGLVHLRTDALSDSFDPSRLVASGLDVLSIDVLAATAETYAQVAGVDRYETVKSRVEAALAERGERAGLPGLWVVPRITRCDAVYEEIEPFYNGWLMACCNAVIDPIPAGADLPATARIRPLPLPALARERDARERVVVRSDGVLHTAAGDAVGPADEILTGGSARRTIDAAA